MMKTALTFANMTAYKTVLVVFMVMIVNGDEIPSVQTNIGIVNGRTEKMNVFGEDYSVTKYLGVPYAEPPVGDLRFRKPVPKSRLTAPLDAVKFGNACLQVDIGLQPQSYVKFSEDCLYLNIYVPEKRYMDEKLAVMTWFHGGGWIFGSADIYPGDNLAASGHVIVVTVNYRLSLWGFLSTGDEHSLGNYGLWDQRQALIWIHENIEAFGGDPSRVTIFGESAGGGSTVYQGMYPENKGLFQRIIAQSGTAGAWWSIDFKSIQNTKRLANYVGCANESNRDLINCLRGIPAEKLSEAVNDFNNGFKAVPLCFIPSFDADFVTFPNVNTFRKGIKLPEQSHDFYMSLDVMGGMNSGEGSLALSPFFGVRDPKKFLPDTTEFKDTLVPALQEMVYPGCKSEAIRDAIISEYANLERFEDKDMFRQAFLEMHGDFIFTDPLHRMLEYHVTSTKGSYMYYFDGNATNHLFFNLDWFQGLGHGDEIPFVFGFKNPEHTTEWNFSAKDWEKQMSKSVIKLWSNFAKTGNPNSPEHLDIDWLPYTRNHQHYLEISRDLTSSNVKQHLKRKGANFWANVLPKIAESVNCYMELPDKGTCSKKSDCSP